MSIIEKAIIFAAKAHEGQTRKSTDIPYITHPFAVGMLLQKAKCSDEVIAAGILHDTLEDTSVTYEELTEHFGERIAILVRAASEPDKSLPWNERKQHTIDSLKQASLEEIQVITADKLHNLRTIRADLEVIGEKIWERFNRGKRDQHWYYSSIVKELAPRKKEWKLIRELEKEVKEIFGSLNILTNDEISLLFSCTYYIGEHERRMLEKYGLTDMAEELSKEAMRIYREEYDSVTAKLDDLSSGGIEFQSNSDGPFLLASFCVALQNKMKWTDQELFKHVKRNKTKL
ncbi:HD domain-containing protein [Bacillus smithii]|uniref:HD domain-containing protein n=1 Tax=Bacillus smithii TaxID=1479 RepID=UPI00065E0BD3|nr:HD domain-containing protein [Bacillus smithii]AKP48750.1 GTP pyrophosphokinase [Bacillus smithii]